MFGKPADLKTIYSNGAIIVDVRTPEEYRTGHIQVAVNIPVDRIRENIPNLQKKGTPIIVCCRSGARSGMAKDVLLTAGLEVYNGGSWEALEKKIL